MKIISRKKINIRTMLGVFEIILEKWEGDRGYVVRVPKYPEIITQGDSIKEARIMAKDAIELCLRCEKDEYNTNIKGQRSSKTTVASRF